MAVGKAYSRPQQIQEYLFKRLIFKEKIHVARLLLDSDK